MEYREFKRGKGEKFSVLGLGMGGIQQASEQEIEAVVTTAIDHGINFFDLCAGGKKVYEPFGRAIEKRRDQVYFQLHFGAVYNEKGEYGWSRNLNQIKETFDWELKALRTDYVDFGFLHCVDEEADFEELVKNGIFDFVKELKESGKIHYIGFSSHTPAVAQKVIDTGIVDMMMFSINPAYDLEKGDEYDIGSTAERAELFKRCQAEGIGISVMKPFHGGQLLSEKTSPFKIALSRIQCLQYVLDRPGVLSAVPGVRNLKDLQDLLEFPTASSEEKDYSVIGQFTPAAAVGHCVYCNHCLPCPVGIDIGLVNKYYDLALAKDAIAANHYRKLSINASACISCHHCDQRCPFHTPQSDRMKEIAKYFG